MLEDELERANATIAELQKEKDVLNAQLEQWKKYERHRAQKQKYDKDDNISMPDLSSLNISSFDNDLSLLNDPEQMQLEIRTLRKKTNDKNDEIQSLKAKHADKEKEMNHIIESNRLHIERLQQQLDKYRNELQKLPSELEYEALKKKVVVLQQQFLQSSKHGGNMANDGNNNDNDNDNDHDGDRLNEKFELHDGDQHDDGNNNNDAGDGDDQAHLNVDMSLETLFYRKTRKLETQITKLKVLQNYDKKKKKKKCMYI
ncbi:hypothetical protein RFI_01031 [Reticulomyxa filosa]|uniref:Uncharacterized protein n=1 Tax=Reticulomyxa filosa TaxID=46433 RepID=X6PBZ5_RETFI|nr:hypothetical protein RFI_01031 [Reticulomyxa filosa]|eukprot:ETO36030.1 hypothetical protein RFI_01031 [Reticulomyxa filosa]